VTYRPIIRSVFSTYRAPEVGGTGNDIVSSSLPRDDRKLVRTPALRERVLAEARSRAPRRPASCPALATVD